ncbi:hypothetical protein Ae707Ps1_6244c [Pseudonocardia sp. Ae707_Ps1]|nr:hypothetical protein Ae707Ps1_6244c [Pseudonocardia sp. Ae707_Ps1]
MHHRRFEQRHRVQQRRRVHRRLRRLKQRDHPVITHREQPSFTVDRTYYWSTTRPGTRASHSIRGALTRTPLCRRYDDILL